MVRTPRHLKLSSRCTKIIFNDHDVWHATVATTKQQCCCWTSVGRFDVVSVVRQVIMMMTMPLFHPMSTMTIDGYSKSIRRGIGVSKYEVVVLKSMPYVGIMANGRVRIVDVTDTTV